VSLPISDVPLMLSLAIVIGLCSMIIARRLAIPGIVVLLISGVACGPDGLNWIDPRILGSHLQALVGTAVAVILFEGGLQLNIGYMRKHQIIIQRLMTTGVVLTAAGATLVAYLALGWDWKLCVLFGTLVIVTGPTVVSPLLKRIRVQKDVHNILQAEGILIDPIGALIAVIAFDVVTSNESTAAIGGLFDLGLRLSFGALIGFGFGTLLVWMLKRPNLVPDMYNNILTLGFVLAIFHGSNQFFHESGIMATTIAGMTVGNHRLHSRHNMIDFKEQLTYLLIGLLFILLTANIRIADVQALGWPGLIAVVGLIFVVRPFVIFVSSRGTKLSFRKKLFMSWMGPRGIVAAAVTSLFATRMTEIGMEGGEKLQALVFLVIAVTVILQGLSADLIAKLLKIRLPRDNGYVIIGSHSLSRTLGHLLAQSEDDVVFIDKNSDACAQAEADEFRVVFGDAMDQLILKRARVTTRRAVIAMTDNEGVNLEALRKCRLLSSDLPLFIIQSGGEIDKQTLEVLHVKTAFSARFNLSYWNYHIDKKQVVLLTKSLRESMKVDQAKVFFESLDASDVLPIVQKYENRAKLFDAGATAWPKDLQITMLVKMSATVQINEKFAALGWQNV